MLTDHSTDSSTNSPTDHSTENPAELDDEGVRTRLAADLERARRRTHVLTDAVDADDLVRQHSPLMSPLVWDLAHIGNQEELWLLRDVGGRDPLLPETVDQLYDAFQNARSARTSLPLLEAGPSRAYVRDVRGRVLDLLERTPLHGRPLVQKGFAFGMILQHEQQHDETMLATHQLRAGPPVLSAPPPPPATPYEPETVISAGGFTMGTDTEPWALDNERPAHRVELPAFAIDTVPVSNRAYLEFMDAGGYDDPHWWHPLGWTHRQEADLEAPLFWSRAPGTPTGWVRHVFGVTEPVDPSEPVVHVNWYEADAYARWAGKRLPTEAEWEKAARHDPATGRSRRYPWGDEDPTTARANLGQQHLRPAPVGAYAAGESAYRVRQMIGDVWEWTSSTFAGYPGFRAWPYREYSEVFFGPDSRVLRGGSFGTDAAVARGTFRNWDYPIRRQIFSGFRCARSLPSSIGESG